MCDTVLAATVTSALTKLRALRVWYREPTDDADEAIAAFVQLQEQYEGECTWTYHYEAYPDDLCPSATTSCGHSTGRCCEAALFEWCPFCGKPIVEASDDDTA